MSEDTGSLSSGEVATLMDNFLRDHNTLLEITRGALSTCLETHQPKCSCHPLNSTGFLPTRLLDVENVDRLKLVLTAESDIQDRRYVPLSHQWGTPDEAERQAMTTISDTLETRINGLDIRTLPRRYQTVIMVCHALGVRYLWIDSLCILQDSDEDWAIECTKMTKVYEHGLFTICSNLPSGDDGFIPPDPVQWAVKLWKGGPNQAWLSKILTEGPLSRRAWCLQERHLSPRILHIFLGPIWVWECDTRVRGCSSRGFVYATDIVGNLDWRKINFHNIADSTSSRQALLRLWDILVVDYTQRKVTFENDKLPAISALAQKIQLLLSLDYIAGTWSSDIYSLMWHCDTFFEPSKSTWRPGIERLGPETTAFRAPTFSWASVNGSTYSLDKLTPTESAIIELWHKPGIFDVITRQKFFPLGEVAFESKALESLPDTVGGSSAVITSPTLKAYLS